MLRGYFDGPSAMPILKGHVHLPGLDDWAFPRFIVDTGATTTSIHPVWLTMVFHRPLTKLREYSITTINTFGGGESSVFLVPGEVSFRRRGRRYTYYIEVGVLDPGPELVPPGETLASMWLRFPPILGRDILQHWDTREDRRRGKLEYRVLNADKTERLWHLW